MIIVFKLFTSETIITDVVYEDKEYFLIKQPLSIQIKYDRERKVKMMSETKWIDDISEDEIMLLSKNGVIGFTIASEAHAKIYKDAIKFYETDEHEEEEDVTEEDRIMLEGLNPLKNTLH